MNDRSATINLGGMEFELVLTTKATKEIAKRYGGLENLGDKLMKSENIESTLGEVTWLISLLANQSVLIHNLKHPNDKQTEVTEEMLDLLTSPADMALYKDAITEAMNRGMKRNVESEADPKNIKVE